MLDRLKDDVRVKEIILKHDTLCHDKKHEKTCAELIEKLNFIINHHNGQFTPREKQTVKTIDHKKVIKIDSDHIHVSPTDVLKRETDSLNKIRNILKPDPSTPLNNHRHTKLDTPRHLPDTCLLAQLLRQRFPEAHGN